MRKVNLLLVDDNPKLLRAIRELIAAHPGVDRIECATSGSEALVRAGKALFDLVLTDVAMPNMNGFDLLRNLRALPAPPRVAIMTAHATPEHRAAALRMGAEDCMAKHDLGALIPELIASMGDAVEACR